MNWPGGWGGIRKSDSVHGGDKRKDERTLAMYDRLTDRSRVVLRLAQQEAQRLNHEYVGVEHILLGIAKEGSGTAAHVLNEFDADLAKLRDAMAPEMKPG